MTCFFVCGGPQFLYILNLVCFVTLIHFQLPDIYITGIHTDTNTHTQKNLKILTQSMPE